MSSPASVPGENDRPAETFTNSREGAKQRERRCESRKEKRTESLPCAKGKTQPVTERSSENVKERPTEKNVPEQGCGQFPAQAATDNGYRVGFPLSCQSSLPLSAAHVVPDALQSSPWLIEMAVDTLNLLRSLV